MVVEHEVLPFLDWLLPGAKSPYGALAIFLLLAAIAGSLGLLVGYLLSVFRHGPLEASYNVAQVVADAVSDFLSASFRRTMAMARLAVKESVRGRVVVVFVVFAIVLMYARWFLDRSPDNPSRLYISFVVTATNYLVLVMALFISAMSLPADIKNRTIYTVVTKPVRALEIVLGRILGFSFVASVILAVMCLLSYAFVVVGLNHQHSIDEPAEKIRSMLEAGEVSELSLTTTNAGHSHRVAIDAEGRLFLDDAAGHSHSLTEEDGELRVGPPEDQFQARVPKYGELQFLNRSGGPGEGINVGHEWTYRRYIEGRTLGAAIWTFRNVTPEDFADGLPIEMTLGVYRTHKGNIEEGILGTIEVRAPETQARTVGIPFEAREYQTQKLVIPRTVDVVTSEGQRKANVNLFDELLEDGSLQIVVRCESPGQYFGMAQADLYLKAAERSFLMNFVKTYLGLWMQMVLVISFGVTLSTFLSASIALLATFGVIVIGHFTSFIRGVLDGVMEGNETVRRLFAPTINAENLVEGGGPIESMVRILTQKNLNIDLDLGVPGLEPLIKFLDFGLMSVMYLIANIVPDFVGFNSSEYLANGFNVDANLVMQQASTCLAFVLCLVVAGYFLLRTREIAA